MKPIEVTMQAFGPYLQKTVVDFTLLKENKLYLITGSTGGGKTTILDAMSFALYGKATGGLRDFTQMRNIGAEETTATQIEYVFYMGEIKYKFVRIKSFYRGRKNNELKEKEENAVYVLENGEYSLVCSGSSRVVTEKAEELLGLDCDQFSKVIMLPQGEFKKLLLSSSADKAKIFEKLFGAEKWSKISDEFATKSKNIKIELDEQSRQIQEVLERNEVEGIDALIKKTEETKNEQNKLEETSTKLSKEIKENEAKREKIVEQKNLHEKLEQDKNKKEELESLKQKAIEELEVRKAESKTLETLKHECDKCVIKKENLKKSLESIKKIEELEVEKTNLSSKIDKTILKLESNETNYKDILNREKIGGTFVKETQSVVDTIPSMMMKLEVSKKIDEDYATLKVKEEQLKLDVQNYKIDKENYEKEKILLDTLQEKFNNNESIINQNMAFKLSTNLKEGSPCPVCGSVNHPQLAYKSNSFSKDLHSEQKNLIKAIDEQKLKFENAQKQYVLSTEKGKQTKSELAQQQEKCNSYNVYYKTFSLEFEKQKAELTKLQKLKEQLPKAIEKLEKLKQDRTILEQEKQQLQQQQNDLKTAEKEITATTKTLKENLPQNVANAKLIEEEIANTQRQYNKLMEQSELITKKLNIAKENLLVIETNLKSILENIENNEKLFLKSVEKNSTIYELKDKIDNLLTSLNDEFKVITKKTGQLSQMILSLEKDLKSIEKNVEIYAKKEKEYSRVDKLAKLLAGNNAFKTPIKNFVLGIMLDDIINQSNMYYSILSNDRFNLNRVKTITGGNGYKGLDIEIFDSNIGGQRSITTLSGGELFLASLSLAFGLSDALQSYSGAIRIDSIFIDEGFGTLDKETLEIAMKALNSINNMGRTIGIISHVTELKNKIGAKIEISKQDNKRVINIVTVD